MNRKLELGSGEKPRPGYEHLDFRPGLPHLEYVHDLNKPLPFDEGTFDEVFADNVLEHFPWIRALTILKDWIRVLKPGGVIGVVVPDLAHIINGYIHGTGQSAISPRRKPHAEKGLGSWGSKACTVIKIFGGQDNEGNYHYAAYDAELITTLFQKAGLKNVKTSTKGGALSASGRK